MTAVEPVFPKPTEVEHTVSTLAKEQPEYTPLPCAIVHDLRVPVVTRWRFSPEDLQAILEGGDLCLQQLTFGQGFNPVALTIVPQDENPKVVE